MLNFLDLYKRRLFFLLLLLFFCFFIIQNIFSKKLHSCDISAQESVETLLNQNLWNNRDAYDTAHIMMVPLHHAYLHNTNEKLNFDYFFQRFVLESNIKWPDIDYLTTSHFMYFSSRYLVLKSEFSAWSYYDYVLYDNLLEKVSNYWLVDSTWQWGMGLKAFIGRKKRTEYISSLNRNDFPSYYAAILDEDLMTAAVAADLIFLNKKLDKTDGSLQAVSDLFITMSDIIFDRSDFTSNGGWLFQKGFWYDHKEYLYAGNQKLSKNLKAKKKHDIAQDSSHFHRWPLWLRSFILASSGKRKKKFIKIYKNLRTQFLNKIVCNKCKYPLLNNFQDGNNGVYKYNHYSNGLNEYNGYGPYMLSGVLGVSWYEFLHETDGFFIKYYNSFPMQNAQVDIFTGPNTTVKRNSLYQWPEYFSCASLSYDRAKKSLDIAKNYTLKID